MTTTTPMQQSSGFTEDGQRYEVRDVHLMERADSFLWNDRLYFQIDHRGRAIAYFLQPDATPYADAPRFFYLRDEDTGDFWSAPYDPVARESEAFACSFGIDDIRWQVAQDGLDVALRVLIPREDTVELWSATVTNTADRPRDISLYNLFPIGERSGLSWHSWFDAAVNGVIYELFPYYARVEDYFKHKDKKNNIVCLADIAPTSAETNLADFTGPRGYADPRQLHREALGGGETVLPDAGGAIMQFRRALAAGESFTVHFVFGPAQDRAEMARLRETYLVHDGFKQAMAAVQAFRQTHVTQVEIDTPDAEFNHFVNHWLPNLALYHGQTLRTSQCPCARNMQQDAMGAVYSDPATVRKQYLRVYAFQRSDGFLQHGLPLSPGMAIGGIHVIPHRDMNVWGAPVVHYYLMETGDFSILDEPVPFQDDAAPVSLYAHICLGLEWLLNDRSPRGLSHIGEGDWNDPLNMAGWKGEGESVWLTEALAYALDLWAEVAAHLRDDARADRYRVEAKRCREAVNALAWDGAWYLRGFTDAGRPFGTQADAEGKIFINAQSWAIMSGTATGERAASCIASIERLLLTPAGPMTLAPAFSRMHEDIGKITQKNPGLYENGSVYCHAGAFYAYALYLSRRGDQAFSALRRLLPGGIENTLERSGQAPLYIPNFYGGTAAAAYRAGKSSHCPATGTVAWYYRTVVACLFGVRGEFGGLRIDPQLPAAWPYASIRRQFRGAVYEVHVMRDPRVTAPMLLLDGESVEGTLIPFQEPGTHHQIQVKLPM